ncbi:bZIP transcription factor [Spirosoma taeanense]|uniref:BZIP transcription factor n=1 Tax=Spirosoma taeanense TaxID=2735870 RepID=A0A6M5YG76_9BACT|nr:bZIP transcription factor [Spirosoma taeanense]
MLITGNDNTYAGFQSGEVLSSGSFNTFYGSRAGANVVSGSQNTFIGYETGAVSTGDANTFLGFGAGRSNTSGEFNTFIGTQAGASNTTGSSNFIMGTNSGRNNTTGYGNFFLGDNAGFYNTNGSFNVYLGANAGNGIGVNGQNNTAIGFDAGRANNGGQTNTFVGFRADAGATNLVNAAAIGADAKVTISNALVLGNNVNVGIGNTAPKAKLEITTGTGGSSGLRFTNLTAANTATGSASKFLTVDNAGNVILSTYSASAREAAVESLWKKTETGVLQTAQTGAVVIGKDLRSTPAGYQLYVADGILTEKVKVAVKNSADWSDYVFADNYKLRPLSEVERFVKENKHLPGVPSANDVVEQGIDVGKMDAKLLEKVEELTLYMIQLKKDSDRRINRLENENRRLKQMIRANSQR